MIKNLKHVALLLLILVATSASSQTTGNSPYASYGVGLLKGSLLPQNRAMGGISAGIRKPGGYSNVNLANPASYSSIDLTTFDVGIYTGLRELSTNSKSEKSFNGTLSHITFAIPVSKGSALSFGLLPYSDFGYNYRNPSTEIPSASAVYSGEGGLSKVYLGYGFKIAKNLSLGFNAAYLFGNLKEINSLEFPQDPTALNSSFQTSRSVAGLSIDYGLQYSINTSKASKLILGYSGNSGLKVNSKMSQLSSTYRYANTDRYTTDTIQFSEGVQSKINMPLMHTAGFVFEKTNKWLVGADFSLGKWSSFKEGTNKPTLNDSYGVNLGAQITPDITAVSSYLKLVDYRLGFRYDKTYIGIENNDIKQMALTFGFGFPLPSNRSTFYKINLSAELGQQGTHTSNLVKERFVNINLGFTMNDRWFVKPKFD
ncbi:MAG: Membrane protein [Sphingobacteriales bacterium]|nr:Membrane protein [Sphingobacteriales bacterium]